MSSTYPRHQLNGVRSNKETSQKRRWMVELEDSTMGICPWTGHCQEAERNRYHDEHFKPVDLRLWRTGTTAKASEFRTLWVMEHRYPPGGGLAFTFTADTTNGASSRWCVLVWVTTKQTLWASWRDVGHQDAGSRRRRRRRMDKRLSFSLRSLVVNPRLHTVPPGHTCRVHSHGVHREPQWVQLWAHQTENVPGSALQHHLYAQSPQSLWPTHGCISHGGELFNTHFYT